MFCFSKIDHSRKHSSSPGGLHWEAIVLIVGFLYGKQLHTYPSLPLEFSTWPRMYCNCSFMVKGLKLISISSIIYIHTRKNIPQEMILPTYIDLSCHRCGLDSFHLSSSVCHVWSIVAAHSALLPVEYQAEGSHPPSLNPSIAVPRRDLSSSLPSVNILVRIPTAVIKTP